MGIPCRPANHAVGRRQFLARAASAALLAGAAPTHLLAEQRPPGGLADVTDFEQLTEFARLRATQANEAEAPVSGWLADLDYDAYQHIRFDGSKARWRGRSSTWRLLPFHLGWLFRERVQLFEVLGGRAHPLTFATDDFEYLGSLAAKRPPHDDLPGVAGFKLTHPLNRADGFDEVVSFLGASYFRALGEGNRYGLSARGLAVDSGLGRNEEFPRFSAFWVEPPMPGAANAVVFALLDSPSLTGAYRFDIRPGPETVVEVTARLFPRREVQEIGIAPLTSMFLFGPVNRGDFDDYRPQVHDSSGLRILRADGDAIWRALNNPDRMESAYFGETSPRRFGLHQRSRGFDDFRDSGARYDLRPSVDVEPLGDWGAGAVRLLELPTRLEIHDNIGAFWVPATPLAPGRMHEFAYRLHWGSFDPAYADDRAWVAETSAGVGGASGLETAPDTRKFVVDFEGGLLGRTPEGAPGLEPVVSVTGGTAEEVALYRLPGTPRWRLVVDVAAESGSLVELTAHVAGNGRKLSEIWAFQWRKP